MHDTAGYASCKGFLRLILLVPLLPYYWLSWLIVGPLGNDRVCLFPLALVALDRCMDVSATA